MKLVVDANILVAELMRRRGWDLMRNPQLELYLTEKVKDEAEYELRRRVTLRVSQGGLSAFAGEEMLEISQAIVETHFRLIPVAVDISNNL